VLALAAAIGTWAICAEPAHGREAMRACPTIRFRVLLHHLSQYSGVESILDRGDWLKVFDSIVGSKPTTARLEESHNWFSDKLNSMKDDAASAGEFRDSRNDHAILTYLEVTLAMRSQLIDTIARNANEYIMGLYETTKAKAIWLPPILSDLTHLSDLEMTKLEDQLGTKIQKLNMMFATDEVNAIKGAFERLYPLDAAAGRLFFDFPSPFGSSEEDPTDEFLRRYFQLVPIRYFGKIAPDGDVWKGQD
jgi:hypothetical protein